MENQSYNLLTIRQFTERHPAFSEANVRWKRFRSKDPSDHQYRPFAAAFVSDGRRVLVDEARFFDALRAGDES